VLKKHSGCIKTEALLPDVVPDERKNLLKRYTHQERLDFLEAVMGATVIVPEGEFDADWIRWLKSLAESNLSPNPVRVTAAFTVLRTKRGQFKSSIKELRRLNVDVVALADGDDEGAIHAGEAVDAGARLVLRWPDGWEVEDVAASVLEPALDNLQRIGPPFDAVDSRSALRSILLNHKRDALMRMQVMDAAFEVDACAERAARLVTDLSALASGQKPAVYAWRHEGGVEILQSL
jgi:hypothetical protein